MGFLDRFRSDPSRDAQRARERWLARLPPEARASGQRLFGVIAPTAVPLRPDRERFRTDEPSLVTYGVAVDDGTGQLTYGVGVTEAAAIEALTARLQRDLQPGPVWAPPLLDNRTLAGSGADPTASAPAELDQETYHDLSVWGLSSRVTAGHAFVVVREESLADQALRDLFSGELPVADHWAPTL